MNYGIDVKSYPKLKEIPTEFYKNNKPPKDLKEAKLEIERLNHSISDISIQMEIDNENVTVKQLKALRVKKMQLRMLKEWVYEHYPYFFIKICSS